MVAAHLIFVAGIVIVGIVYLVLGMIGKIK